MVGLLPTIIAHTPLMGYFVRRAARLDGTVTFHSASIGWFSPTAVSGIEIHDAQGETVLDADNLTCDRSLLKLLFNSSNVGTLRIEKPRLTARLARDGSNIESILAPWLTATSGSTTSSSSRRGVDLALQVVDGEATIVDQETQQSWHVTNLQFALDLSRQLLFPAVMEGAATVDDRGHSGGLAFKWHLKPSDAPPADPASGGMASADGDLSLQTTTLPLALFQRLAARGMPGLKLDGTLGANLDAQWTGPNAKLSGSLNGSDVCVESPSLGSDVFRLRNVQVACKAARQDKQVTIEEAKLDCDVGNLAAVGHIDLGERGLQTPADLLRQPDCSLQGTLDLAQLARLLPGMLRIRQGTEITSGQVLLTVRTINPAAGSPQAPAALAWQARLETKNLMAIDHGRQIPWDNPLAIVAALHQTDQGPVVDSLQCQSDFLRVDGRGTPDQFTAAVTLNLRQLTNDLGRFIDLGGLALAGDGSGNLQWSRNAAGDFQAGGQIDLHNFQLAIPQHQPWVEDKLAVNLDLKGHADFASPARLDAASVQLSTRGDQVNIRLLQPDSLWGNGPLQLGNAITYQADLADLQPWIVAATGSNGLRLAGRVSGTAQIEQTTGQIILKTEGDVQQLSVAAPSGQAFQEPRAHCVVQCSYLVNDSVLKIDQCELSTSLATARAGGQIALRSPGDVQLNGDVGYQWDKLNFLLRPYCGTAVQFAGGGTSPIAYRGPFSPAAGQASAALQFSGASIYGFQVGPGELKLHLANGVLQADPLEVSCNQGRISLQPALLNLAAHADRQPMEFRLSAGTPASHIQLDQAACRSALKYVVPVLASVTQSEGQFSVQLEGCRIPIGDLNRAEIAGRIIVHSARMNPGPLVEQLASLVSASPSLVSIEPESVILFRMTGGRIYHQGLALQFPDVTMRTYGSVGLDDTLKLMVETSVPLTWLPSNSVTDAIRKQKMQIPLGGTLKSPQLDRAELGG